MARHQKILSVNVDHVAAGAEDATGASAGVLVTAPDAGKCIVVHSYGFTLSAAGALTFRTAAAGGGTAVGRTVRASAAGQGMAEAVQRPDYLFAVPAGTALYGRISAALTLSGGISYSVVPESEVL